MIGQVKHDVEFHCGVHGIPRPIIQWVKDGRNIVVEDYFQLLEGSTSLRILGLVPSDAGMYQCFASNDLRAVHSSAQLIVITPPGEKTNIFINQFHII